MQLSWIFHTVWYGYHIIMVREIWNLHWYLTILLKELLKGNVLKRFYPFSDSVMVHLIYCIVLLYKFAIVKTFEIIHLNFQRSKNLKRVSLPLYGDHVQIWGYVFSFKESWQKQMKRELLFAKKYVKCICGSENVILQEKQVYRLQIWQV